MDPTLTPETVQMADLWEAASLGNLQGNMLLYMGSFILLALCFLGYGKIRTLIRRG